MTTNQDIKPYPIARDLFVPQHKKYVSDIRLCIFSNANAVRPALRDNISELNSEKCTGPKL